MQFSFGAFRLDRDTRQLWRGRREIHLQPKAFDLLLALVMDRPKVLSKEQLQQQLWPKTFVAEANLSNIVAEIRAALGDRARDPHFIRTAHGVGYAFCGAATVVSPGPPMPADPARCWLEWGTRRFHLSMGENLVGRDPDVQIQLDASTVSRHHARVVLTSKGATIADLDSKNGTFVGERRVSTAVPLTDGSAIRIGSLLVTFRLQAGSASTETESSTA